MADDSPPKGPTSIADMNPEDVRIETIDAFHLGGTSYAASFELTNREAEFARSYLLEVDFGETLDFTQRLVIEDTIMSHASLAPGRHVVLELGGKMHDLSPTGDTVNQLSEGMLRRLWHLDDARQYVIGDYGISYMRETGLWERIQTFDMAVLRGIHGPRPDAVHACGHGGVLVRLEGRTWNLIDIPDQRNFHAVEVSANGDIHIGGADGVAYALIDEELIALDTQPWNYFGICSFKGKRYWTDANYGISIQEENAIVPLRNLGQGFYMHASPDRLVISGWREVFVFDGENWSGFELGYDGDIFLRRLDMANYGG